MVFTVSVRAHAPERAPEDDALERTLGNVLDPPSASDVDEDAMTVRVSARGTVLVDARVRDDWTAWDARDWIERSIGMREIPRCAPSANGRAWRAEVRPETPGEDAAACAARVGAAARAIASDASLATRRRYDLDLECDNGF